MSPRTPHQNKEIREQTRSQIKDAAFTLFGEQGFANTSVRAIAEKAGKSKGLIYHYFDSKEDILQGIFEDLTKLGNQAMDFPDGLTAKERLHYLLTTIFDYVNQSTEVIRLMMSLALQPDAMQTLKTSIEKYNRQQLDIMAALFDELGYKNPEEEAYYLGAKLDGITMGYITLGDDYPFDSIKQKIMDDYVSI